MGADSPYRVPGEAERAARERLEEGVTGLYGDLPPGAGPLLETSARMIARAFDAYADGDLEMSGAVIAEGLAAAGDIFAGLAERLTMPAWPSRVDSLTGFRSWRIWRSWYWTNHRRILPRRRSWRLPRPNR